MYTPQPTTIFSILLCLSPHAPEREKSVANEERKSRGALRVLLNGVLRDCTRSMEDINCPSSTSTSDLRAFLAVLYSTVF